MKIIKILAALVGFIIVVALVLAYGVGKEDVHIERSMIVEASPEAVFYNIYNLPRWKEWSSWDRIDSNMQSEYSDPPYGVGSYHSWTSDHNQVGNGKLTVIEVEENKLVKTELDFYEQGKGYGDWIIEPVEDGTKVTATMDAKMEGFKDRLMSLVMDRLVGSQFEKGIQRLGEVSKNTELSKPKRMSDFSIEEVKAVPMYSVTETMDLDEMNEKLSAMYGKLIMHVRKSKATNIGKPLAVWHKFSREENSTTVECGIPVGEPVKEAGDIKISEIPSGTALTAIHYGDYANLEYAHSQFESYMKENNLTQDGAVWEWYLTDMEENPDTNTWETKIFYPIAMN